MPGRAAASGRHLQYWPPVRQHQARWRHHQVAQTSPNAPAACPTNAIDVMNIPLLYSVYLCR
ncbi:hypothetical protein L665_01359 [Ralstonia solanacearum SD54]|nr:hypothetical protein F504_4152 [Ralstonia pseudosolanacearum FQY_4]ANH36022.1 hypothetical protein A3768_5232 [Ralstonia solanacearum]ARU25003.1 integrase [Ralstonia solanacearum]ESS49798.1 hypothetical protein L665_01359 [Ralstonia solanacearum SD54]